MLFINKEDRNLEVKRGPRFHRRHKKISLSNSCHILCIFVEGALRLTARRSCSDMPLSHSRAAAFDNSKNP
jgi:hypothetical protein